MVIPKLIHHLWIDEKSKGIPKDIDVNLASWRITHPDYTQKVWSLEELSGLLEDFYGLNVLECVNACRFPAMQSDIVRLALVYEYGGFWNDLKNMALNPCLSSYQEKGKLILVEHPPLASRPDPVDYLCNGFFAAPKGNQFIIDVLSFICRSVNSRKEGGVFGISGGAVFMRLLQRDKERESNHKVYSYELIRHKDFWGECVKRTSASYNEGNNHWSIKQKVHSLYL